MADRAASSEIEDVLFGPADGWSPVPAVYWLLSEGRLLPDQAERLGGLCERLLAAGAPLWRVRVSFRMLHPQIFARGVTWLRGRGRPEIQMVGHHIPGSDDYIGSPIQALHRTGKPVRRRLDRLDPEHDHHVLRSIAAEGGTDYVALPLVFSDGQINALTVATDRPGGFADSDIRKFRALAMVLAPAVESHAQRYVVRSILDTYLGHRSGERVLKGLVKRGDGETIDAALWFGDLRDFTLLTESLPTERVLDMLNTYFETVAAAVTARGGEVLRFIGDAMLIVFPTEGLGSEKAACTAAFDSARDALSGLATVNSRRRKAGEPEIRFGVGLHVGRVIYGNVGAPDRLDFTVMGAAVNRTARIEGLTRTLGQDVLMSADFVRNIDVPVRSLGAHAMKGIKEPQEVFALRDGTR